MSGPAERQRLAYGWPLSDVPEMQEASVYSLHSHRRTAGRNEMLAGAFIFAAALAASAPAAHAQFRTISYSETTEFFTWLLEWNAAVPAPSAPDVIFQPGQAGDPPAPAPGANPPAVLWRPSVTLQGVAGSDAILRFIGIHVTGPHAPGPSGDVVPNPWFVEFSVGFKPNLAGPPGAGAEDLPVTGPAPGAVPTGFLSVTGFRRLPDGTIVIGDQHNPVPHPVLPGHIDSYGLAYTRLAANGPIQFTFTGAHSGSIVPEPSTWVLLGTGMVALAGVAVRRRRGA
jgi:hypothetical protein